MEQELALYHGEEGKFGPAMLALNPRQRAFVDALLQFGDNDHTRAAKLAGYSGSPETMRVTGHRLAHDDKVRAAVLEEAQRRMDASGILAVSKLVEIARNDMHKDQLKAVGMILNRVGLHEKTEHKVTVENKDPLATIERIKRMAQLLGVDPEALARKMLGSDAPQVIEVTATVVPIEDEEWTAISPD